MRLLRLLAVCLFTAPAFAEEPWYDDKRITVIIPTAPGGSYLLYGQLLAQHLGQHILGEPTIVLEYMHGAGGMRASNYVSEVAARDGTVLYLMHQNALTAQLLSPDAARYNIETFPTIGVMSALNSVMVIRKDTGVAHPADLKTTGVVIGSTGRGSYQFMVPAFLNQYGRAKFNIVPSYSGSGDVQLAIERGEIGGFMNSLVSVQEKHPDWVDGTGHSQVVLQVGANRAAALPDVPLLTELAENEKEKSLYQFISLPNAMARALVLPPQTPQDRVETLRTAFDEMIADPEFRKDAAAIKLPLESTGHEEMDRLISAIRSTPSETIDLAKEILSQK